MKRLQGLSEKTICCYMQFVTPFLNYVGMSTNVADLTKDSVTAYIGILFKRDISRATLATYVRHVKVFLCWLESEYDIDLCTHSIKVPKTAKKIIHVYDDSEIREIFSVVRADREWLTLRNKAMIALMLDSGLRQNEVCTLLRCDVSYRTNTLKICGKGNKERIVPLGQLSQYFMKEYENLCPYENSRFFVSRNGGVVTCDSVKHFMYKLGKTLPFEFSSHKLRHNFATNWCIDQYEKHKNIDIYRLMILMGHEEIDTTRRYLHFANQIIASKSNISHLDMVLMGEN